nr:MAG TPA: hypothetical protein [Caudoviricetes sp.]
MGTFLMVPLFYHKSNLSYIFIVRGQKTAHI